MITAYFDVYTIRARLAPCLIVTLPLAAAVLPYYDKSYGWGFFSLLFVQISIALLMAQFARDAGKKIQNELFRDEMPHICFLRYRDTRYSFEKKKKLHIILSEHCGSEPIEAGVEELNTHKADEIYGLWCDWLKQYTRKRDTFYLVQEENINFGFRRNLYGLKWIWLSSIILGCSIFLINLSQNVIIRPENITTIVLILASILSRKKVTKEWVIAAANEYALQLHLAALALNLSPRTEKSE